MAGFSILQEAAIPFNGSGSFSLAEPAFIPETTISSAAMNSDLTDIATGLSEVLTTDGQSEMTGVLKGFAGSSSNPGYAFATDPNSGMYRKGPNNVAIAVGGSDTLDITSTGINIDGTVNATSPFTRNGLAIQPIGVILAYGGVSPPGGWLLCYGQAISRTTYSELYAVLGDAFGAGNGTTTFNLPDIRGRVIAGRDSMGGVAAGRLTATTMTPNGVTVGAVGGAQTHTLTTAQLATHTHGVTDPGHTHAMPIGSRAISSVDKVSPFSDTPSGTIATNSATTGISINNAGSGSEHNNVQPTIITNYIIYAGV